MRLVMKRYRVISTIVLFEFGRGGCTQAEVFLYCIVLPPNILNYSVVRQVLSRDYNTTNDKWIYERRVRVS
jgi:hypothetical protein